MAVVASQARTLPSRGDARGSSGGSSGSFPEGALADSQATRAEESSPALGLLSVSFNQDCSCFASGRDDGFRIYNCEPLKETIRREFGGGGIGQVEMLFRCNLLALVGGGNNPRYPPTKVIIWDDNQGRCIGELTFRSEVRSVRLRRDRIVVVLEHKIYVYNFADLKLLHQIETVSNPRGLCALSQAPACAVLATLGLHRGQVRVELYDIRKTRFISAHDSAIACFALTLDGRRLATTSTKGTLIRIFDTVSGAKLQELRRGADRATIFSLAFSPSARFLALSSDKGTVHVFAINCPSPSGGGKSEEQEREEEVAAAAASSAAAAAAAGAAGSSPGANPGSTLSFMKGVLPKYFSSEWSFAQFHLPEGTRALVAFGAQKHTLLTVSSDGSFFRLEFDPERVGEMRQREYVRFLSANPNGGGAGSLEELQQQQ